MIPFLRAVFYCPAKAEGRLPGVVEVGIDEVSLYEVLVLGKLLLHSRLQLNVSRVLPWEHKEAVEAAISCQDSSLVEWPPAVRVAGVRIAAETYLSRDASLKDGENSGEVSPQSKTGLIRLLGHMVIR
jgi:hypothetical protein